MDAPECPEMKAAESSHQHRETKPEVDDLQSTSSIVCRGDYLSATTTFSSHRKHGFFIKLLTATCITLPDSSVDSEDDVYYSSVQNRAHQRSATASSMPYLPGRVVDIYDNILSNSSLTGRAKRKKLRKVRKICPTSFRAKFGEKSITEIVKSYAYVY